jgi:AbrB family looped-hinge helix DNA binding protein
METSITTSKGQVLIPKRIRDRYGIRPGKPVTFIETAEGVLLKPADSNYISQFRGILKKTGDLKKEMKEFHDEEEAIIEGKLMKIFGKMVKKKNKIISATEWRRMNKQKIKI